MLACKDEKLGSISRLSTELKSNNELDINKALILPEIRASMKKVQLNVNIKTQPTVHPETQSRKIKKCTITTTVTTTANIVQMQSRKK